MRVIAGSKKGMRITAPPGEETRPTTDKVREAIFGSIQFDISGARVLDLFAGSGAMGVEALSRGADECVFCDVSKAAAKVVSQNAAPFEGSYTLVHGDFERALELSGQYDFIFLDPPYKSGFYERAINRIMELDKLKPNGKLIVEHDTPLPKVQRGLKTLREKKYGKTLVTFLGRIDEGDD